MSKVEIDAATRDYIVKPRLDYRTVQGVNGPLVILEVSRRSLTAQIQRGKGGGGGSLEWQI
jgi:V-type H+-transporting ATPase subunit B